MSGNKKKKRRLIRLTPFWLRLAIILVLLIGLILAVGTLVLPGFGIDLHLPFTSRTRIAESEILLKDIKPLFLLNTVEYTYQSVFPYDFIPPRTDPLEAYRRVLQGLEVRGITQ